MIDRRTFFRQSTALLPLALHAPRLVRALHAGPLPFGLYFDEQQLPTLQRRFNEDPLFRPFRDELAAKDRAAERRFLTSEVKFNDHLYDIARVAATAQQMSFYALMTGDEDAAGLALLALRTLAKFPKWDYFQEAGRYTISIQRGSAATFATALALDWLGDRVSDDERRELLTIMAERGCETTFRTIYGMRYPDRVVGWSMDPESNYLEHRPGDIIDLSNWPIILNRNNLKAVPASALAIGAIAYRMTFGETEDTARWIEQAAFSLGEFDALFEPDGSYEENISYADYTAVQLMQGITLLDRHAGIDLLDIVNWQGLMTFSLEMSMPTHAEPRTVVNFGDTGRSMFSGTPFWIAAHARDGQAQWYGTYRTMGHNEWSVMWYDERVRPEPPPRRPHLYVSALDWLVARTGYAPDDLVVALRSGRPANHEHADRNSLIVKCYGEVLVADPYRPPYSYSDPSWMLRTTAGHSALLIDGKGHQYHDGREGTNASDAAAHIVRSGERNGYMFWASDATEAYALVMPDVSSVTRSVVVLPDWPAIVVVDKVIKSSTPSTLEARFFADNMDGEATVSADNAMFAVERPHGALQARGFSTQKASASAGQLPIPAEVAARHPFVAVKTAEPALESLLITVLLPRRPGQAETIIQADHPVPGHHRIALSRDGQSAACTVIDSGTLPEFDIEV
ncbi:MAG: heparinase II/III family protein [Rhodothermales bacterium]